MNRKSLLISRSTSINECYFAINCSSPNRIASVYTESFHCEDSNCTDVRTRIHVVTKGTQRSACMKSKLSKCVNIDFFSYLSYTFGSCTCSICDDKRLSRECFLMFPNRYVTDSNTCTIRRSHVCVAHLVE